MPLQNGSEESSTSSNATDFQGPKWQDFYDLEKIIRNVQIAERRVLRGHCGSANCSNTFAHQPATSSSPPRSPTSRCTKQTNQVQRLNGEDMHFFGIAPLTESMETIVCGNCNRTYTKIGLNNHMMLHHPQIWKNTSTKLEPSTDTNAWHENLKETTRELSLKKELGATDSDIVSTPRTHSTGRKGKSKSNGGSGGRPRSKSKHSTASSSSLASTPARAEPTPTKSGKGYSKKSAKLLTTTVSSTPAANITSASKESSNTKESIVPIVLYSSSSNSSCSLPSTPKTSTSSSTTASVPIDNISIVDNIVTPFSPVDIKERLVADPVVTKSKSSSSSKKKSKGLSASESNVLVAPLGTEFEGTTSCGSTPTKSSSSSRGVKGGKKRSVSLLPPLPVKETNSYDQSQISELDQAVSSITDSYMKSSSENEQIGNVTQDNEQQQQVIQQQDVPGIANFQNQMAPQIAQTDESLPIHETSDDNSMLTLEDMLDSKFISEILSTTESDINFETEMEPSNPTSYVQQPVNKRMRYEDTHILPVQQQQVQQQVSQVVPEMVTGEFAMFSTQQPQQQQQHYPQYNTGNMEDIKLFNNDNMQQVPQMVDAQYQLNSMGNSIQQQQTEPRQEQMHTLDGMNLQQLLYQHQNYGTDSNTASMQETVGEEYGSICVNDDLQKSKEYAEVDVKLMDYTQTQQDPEYEQSVAAVTAAAQFNVFNVPSLTDELSSASTDAIMPNLVNNTNLHESGTHQYMVPGAATPDGQVIYEINDNNQVSVMSQQRQQQVIADFLNQAGYGAVENVNVAAQPLSDSTNLQNERSETTEFWDDGIDDFDYSKIETVKSVSSSSNSFSSSAGIKYVKQESGTLFNNYQHTKNFDDFYSNVYLYSGIPRPLSVNNFGLVKLPNSSATTFKKQLLTTRKAYNNPFTLSTVGSGSLNASSTRFSTATSSTKGAQSYFANSNQSSNEYLIGNISISNATGAAVAQQQLLKQDGSGIEMTLNTNNSQTTSRGRQKGTLVVPSGVASAHNKAKFIPNSSLSPAAGGVANSTTANTRGSGAASSSKTSNSNFVASSTNNDRGVKFVKRSFLAKLDTSKNSNSAFSAKKLTEIINGTNKGSKPGTTQHVFAVPQDPLSTQQQLQHQNAQQNQQFNDAMSQDIKNNDIMTEQLKRQRVQNFFDRRQKLLTNNNSNGNSMNTGLSGSSVSVGGGGGVYSTTLMRQPQLLKQQLMRTLSDYSANSMAHCKVTSATSNKATNNTNSNDMMRVYV